MPAQHRTHSCRCERIWSRECPPERNRAATSAHRRVRSSESVEIDQLPIRRVADSFFLVPNRVLADRRPERSFQPGARGGAVQETAPHLKCSRYRWPLFADWREYRRPHVRAHRIAAASLTERSQPTTRTSGPSAAGIPPAVVKDLRRRAERPRGEPPRYPATRVDFRGKVSHRCRCDQRW